MIEIVEVYSAVPSRVAGHLSGLHGGCKLQFLDSITNLQKDGTKSDVM